MKDCKHQKVDTKPLYKIKVGTCGECGTIIKWISIPIDFLEENNLLDKLKSMGIIIDER